MAKLKATRCILFQNRLYDAGDELPIHDTARVNAWLEAKSAVWEEGKPTEYTAKQDGTTPGSDSGVKQAPQTKHNGKKAATR